VIFMSSGVSTVEEYRRLRLAGHVVRKLMLEIPKSCKLAVRGRGRWNYVKWRYSLLVSLDVRDLQGQVVTLILTNTSRVK
jgi:DNA-binding IclR family transcriptional regulator